MIMVWVILLLCLWMNGLYYQCWLFVYFLVFPCFFFHLFPCFFLFIFIFILLSLFIHTLIILSFTLLSLYFFLYLWSGGLGRGAELPSTMSKSTISVSGQAGINSLGDRLLDLQNNPLEIENIINNSIGSRI